MYMKDHEKAKLRGRGIEVPGFGYNRCPYKKIEDQEKEKMKPKKEKPINLILLEQFLFDQRKTKVAE